MEPLIHPQSLLELRALAANLHHALLLHGPSGVGLAAAVNLVLNELNVAHITTVTISPDEKGSIGIDELRSLRRASRIKYSGRRIVIVADAECMTDQAQNAFLKLLEEPTQATHFIITSHYPERLLPTVSSRLQSLQIRPISKQMAERLLDEFGVSDGTKRAQLLFLAGGLPERLQALATDEAEFARVVRTVQDARQFVAAKTYQRLVVAAGYSNRAQALGLLDMAIKITTVAIQAGSDAAHIQLLSTLHSCAAAISGNANVRLQLTRAALAV